jgi:hypothetical protein
MRLIDILKNLVPFYHPKNPNEQETPVLNKEEEEHALKWNYVEWWSSDKKDLINLSLRDYSLSTIIFDESGYGSGAGAGISPWTLSKEDKRYYHRLVNHFKNRAKK